MNKLKVIRGTGGFMANYIHSETNDGLKPGELYPDDSIVYYGGGLFMKQHKYYADGRLIPDEFKLKK